MYQAAALNAYLDTHHNRFLDELRQFIAQPSVAAEKRAIQPMADLLSERLRKLGATVKQYPLPEGSPVVYAELGQGDKTVLPAHAFVKLDFRLVPNLTPEIVQTLLRAHLNKRGFADIEIRLLGGENPADSPLESLVKEAAVAACQSIWNKVPIVSPRFAGSGPMYPLSTMLGIPTISAGAMGHPEARVHSPNENILERDYFDGMRFMAAFLDNFAHGNANS